MQRLLEFIGHHAFLAGGAVLAALAVMPVELKERIQKFAALSAMQAVRLMNQGALVLDLRGKAAYDAGHIGDARNIPAADFESQADSLKKWRDKTVITYYDNGVGGVRRGPYAHQTRLHQGVQSRGRSRTPGRRTICRSPRPRPADKVESRQVMLWSETESRCTPPAGVHIASAPRHS